MQHFEKTKKPAKTSFLICDLVYCIPAVSLISRSVSSDCDFASSAALFLTTAPHFSHLWIIIKPFFASGSVCIGRRIPQQSFALSPGFISTWSEQRQKGQ